MPVGFHLTTSDPEEFQDHIAPLSRSCRVRPAKGTHFHIAARAVQLDKLSLFVVKAPSLKVHTPAPRAYFGLNVPLGRPFLISETGQRCQFRDDLHLVMPDRPMNLEAASELSVLAVKLNRAYVLDYAVKLSGSHRSFEPAMNFRLPHSTAAVGALLRDIAGLWSALQRGDGALGSAISIAETKDAIFSRFVLATQAEEKTCSRSGHHADTTAVARAEEYLRARLALPVSRAELAAATSVSIRTLSRDFVKRWGTGPMGFLRAQRMEAAYRDLLGAEPGETSVTEVACRYGFTHLGKFAGEYKCLFRELPSETLRH